jgi:hypothetical protein
MTSRANGVVSYQCLELIKNALAVTMMNPAKKLIFAPNALSI